MTDKLDEQLSALMDDELPESERELLLRRLAVDNGLRDRWERYHLARDLLHNELPDTVDLGLSERVRAALEQEPAPEVATPAAGALRQMFKPLAGLAIAVSVAALAIVGLQQLTDTGSSQQRVPEVASTGTPDSGYVRVAGTRWDMQRPEIEARLNNLLVNHNEYSSETNLQGMLHYVRIAGYDAK
jgi:sigma-E factor negative regulatory protein RseA